MRTSQLFLRVHSKGLNWYGIAIVLRTKWSEPIPLDWYCAHCEAWDTLAHWMLWLCAWIKLDNPVMSSSPTPAYWALWHIGGALSGMFTDSWAKLLLMYSSLHVGPLSGQAKLCQISARATVDICCILHQRDIVCVFVLWLCWPMT